MPTPDSQPNASQITNAVEIGMIVAARTEAPKSPTANSSSAKSPGDRLQARAASAALSISPWPKIVTAVAMTMNTAMTFVQIAPPIASACSSRSSSSPIAFSATALWR